jgi:hypothetical protein
MDMPEHLHKRTRHPEFSTAATCRGGDAPAGQERCHAAAARSPLPARETRCRLRPQRRAAVTIQGHRRTEGSFRWSWRSQRRAWAAALVAALAAGLTNAAAAPDAAVSHGTAALRAKPSWWLPSGQQGSVLGGSSLTVSGLLFDTTKTLAVSFSGHNREIVPDPLNDPPTTVTAYAVPRTTSEMVVVVPGYPLHEGEVTVSVADLEGASLALALAPGRSQMFQYLAEWGILKGHYPAIWHPPSELSGSFWGEEQSGDCFPQGDLHCSAPMSGGANVTLRGVGFQRRICPADDFCRDVTYVLEFRSAAAPGQVVRSRFAVPSDATTLRVPLPASELPAGEHSMELVRESDGITRIGPMESPNVT